ncbi:restriction endonuclease subunit S [Aeromonas veronii]|uniref:restriction endonuclease subunit S n=1 Tax=Aeromonas veronii TaxID=654 RepID=UPI003BA1A668
MGNNWKEVTLSDLGEVARGRSRHRPRYAEHLYGGEYPFIQTGDIKSSGGRISAHTQTYSEAGLAQSRIWPANTMCITIAANIAETGILKYPACFPDSVIGFIANEEKANVYFIEYLFRQLRKELQRQATGSVQDNINLQTLERLRFKIPPVEEQKRIASFLNYLEDKITLNRQINQTLEQMAQALFKSWFVDFDPVIDNALDAGFFEQDLAFSGELLRRAEARRSVREHGAYLEKSKPLPDATRQLFPAAFEECVEPSLGLGGWVPKGWNVAVSGEHIDVRDGTHDSPKKSEHGFPLVTSKNITSGRLNLTSAYLITPNDYNEVNKRSKVNHGDILLTMIGTLGIPCLVSTKDVNFAIKNIGLFKTSETPHLKSYFFELLKSQEMQQFLDSRAAGTTQKYLSLKVLRTINFVLPCSEVLSGFNKLIQSYENKIQMNDEQSSVLANLRDTLLPKLISGELRLDNIEAALTKVEVA